MGPAPEPRKPKVMRVSTRCRTIDELIAAFATLVDEHSLVVLTDQQRTIGSRQPFVVELADGTFVMKGEAEVVESTPPPRGRLRLRFLALDASGREVHQQMLARKQGTGGTSRATLLGMKPLVRIPEVGAPRDPTPPPTPPPKAAPPAPFARSVPSVPPVPSIPAATLPRAPTTVPVPVIPPRSTAAGTAPGARKLPTPPPVPSVPRVPPVAGVAVKPVTGVPVTDPETGLPSFEDIPDLADRTSVDSSIPMPEPAPAPSIEEALAAEVAKPRPATAPLEGDRTPGSPYILPANPFGDVAPESLEAFVECTVYEETGQFSLGEDGSLTNELAPRDEGEDPDPLTTPAFPMYSSAAPPVIEPPPPPVIAPSPAVFTPPPAPVFTPPPVVAAPPAPMVHAPPTPAVTPPTPVIARAPAPTASAVPEQAWPPFDASGPMPVPGQLDLDGAPAKRPPWKWIGIGAAVLGVIVLIVVITSGGGSDSSAASGSGSGTATGTGSGTASGRQPPAGVDAGARAAVIDAGVAPDAVVEAVAAAPDAGAPTPPIAADECHLTLKVEPDGAHLKLAGVKIGDAPFDAAIPCAPAPLTIYRSHYETVIKRIKPEPGEPIVLNVKMVRPMVKVSITSTPPGAMIKLDGASLGKAPTSATVKGYTQIKIEATLKGYQSWSKTVKVEKSTKKIVAPLKKARSR